MAILESVLSKEALKLLNQEYSIFTEVPLFNRCIDAVLLKGDQVITIEFKIKDWRRGVRQIRTHLLAADFSYLCMPARNLPSGLADTLLKMGIGLYLFDIDKGVINEEISPKPSIMQQGTLKEKIITYLRDQEKIDGSSQAFH